MEEKFAYLTLHQTSRDMLEECTFNRHNPRGVSYILFSRWYFESVLTMPTLLELIIEVPAELIQYLYDNAILLSFFAALFRIYNI